MSVRQEGGSEKEAGGLWANRRPLRLLRAPGRSRGQSVRASSGACPPRRRGRLWWPGAQFRAHGEGCESGRRGRVGSGSGAGRAGRVRGRRVAGVGRAALEAGRGGRAADPPTRGLRGFLGAGNRKSERGRRRKFANAGPAAGGLRGVLRGVAAWGPQRGDLRSRLPGRHGAGVHDTESQLGDMAQGPRRRVRGWGSRTRSPRCRVLTCDLWPAVAVPPAELPRASVANANGCVRPAPCLDPGRGLPCPLLGVPSLLPEELAVCFRCGPAP